MPVQKRPGVRTIYLELPEDLAEHFVELARFNRRTLKAEAQLAIERHLASAKADGFMPAEKARGKKKGGGA
jgi:hypothetical protein